MTTLAQRLADRDARERDPFVQIFDAINTANALAESRAVALASANSQINALTASLTDTKAKLATAVEQGNPDTLRKLSQLEHDVSELKEERADLYKSNASNAQRVLALIDSTREQDETIKSLRARIESLEATNKSMATKLADRDELLKEKDNVIQILRDELSAHQLELVQREEQLKEKETKVVDLEKENKSLLDRWIELKQREAIQLNEANEFVEAALKTKGTSDKKTPRIPSALFSIFSSVTPLSKQGSDASDIVPQSDKREVASALPIQMVKRAVAHDSAINCIRINHDGSLLATGGSDNKLIIHDAQTCTVRMALTGSLQGIMSVCFNSAGDCVLGTSNDNSAKIWSLEKGRMRHTLTGHIGKVFAGRFTDNNSVITGSHDRTIKLWDLTKGYCTKTIFTLSSCNDLALLDNDGTAIVSGHLDNNLRIWDTRSGTILREISGIHFGQITGVETIPNYAQVLTTSRDNTLKLIDLRTYGVIMTYANESFKVGMNWAKSCVSPDQRYVACGSSTSTDSNSASVFFWDTLTGACVKVLNGGHHASASVCGVVWNPRGGDVVYSASDRDHVVVQWGSTHDIVTN